LDTDEAIATADLRNSLLSAWFTFDYIIGALDDILAEDAAGSEIRLRLPVREGMLHRSSSSLLDPYGDRFSQPQKVSRRDVGLLFLAVRDLGLLDPWNSRPPHCNLLHEDVEFLRSDIATSIYECLGYCGDHSDIITLGRLAEDAHRSVLGQSSTLSGKAI